MPRFLRNERHEKKGFKILLQWTKVNPNVLTARLDFTVPVGYSVRVGEDHDMNRENYDSLCIGENTPFVEFFNHLLQQVVVVLLIILGRQKSERIINGV